MPFFEENPVTPARVLGRLRRAIDQNRRGAAERHLPRLQPPPEDSGTRGDVLTTVDATIRPVGTRRYRRLTWAPGEAHSVRDELGVAPSTARAERRRSLLYFSQHTDLHICDAQAEARLVGAQGLSWIHPGSDAAHRPQETMAAQVFDQLIRATNRLESSPDSGAPMAWCAQTGDHTDNRLAVEAQWWLGVLAGRSVTPNTGAEGIYEGVQRSGWKTVWNPDVPGRDRPQRNGFPFLPGMLDAAVATFEAEGLEVPWLALIGNHDLLFTGMFGEGRRFGVQGVEEMVRDSGRAPVSSMALLAALGRAWLAPEKPSRWARRGRPGVIAVTPDPVARRPLCGREFAELILAEREGSVRPDGGGDRGFDATAVSEDALWWSRSEGDLIQVIALDTNNHSNGDDGRLGPRQTAWLESELERYHTRYVNPDGSWVMSRGEDRLVIVMSHHNSWVMEHGVEDHYDSGPSLVGEELVELLARFPNVVLWLNGHSHQHRIALHDPRCDPRSAFWEVSTTSLAGWSQQGRLFEVFDNGDATLSILTTVFDHAAPPSFDYPSPAGWTPTLLASLSRELAANDDRWMDPLTTAGSVQDRNVELVLPAPIWLAMTIHDPTVVQSERG